MILTNTSKFCAVTYGQCDKMMSSKQGNSTLGIIVLDINSDNLECYTVTASVDGVSVVVEGQRLINSGTCIYILYMYIQLNYLCCLLLYKFCSLNRKWSCTDCYYSFSSDHTDCYSSWSINLYSNNMESIYNKKEED